ncbi:gluconeogenesis factor YvcK family protein [Tunturiibacter gelidoferens]|uniref:Putative gluconeogenesis factor n=1 Tax=Tunturiibacter gelidiferens TaxID=3069689 RepID=A0AAU7YXV7_9BACT
MSLRKLTESKEKDLRVVAIGGGTGLSTLLRGLKRYVVTPDRRRGIRLGESARVERAPTPPCPEAHCIIRELSAVVTVTDDGGSSGRLREDFKMLPPGDIRNCMVALSEDEHLLSKLFQYRFEHGELEGHSFGNLFVAALSHITGDFAQAVQMSSQILAARGKIFPATNTNVTLAADMDDGSLVRGETNITASKRSIVELRLEPETADPLPQTLEAIANADLITLGPGSLYTSLITNMLVRGIPEALAASRATKVFVCNLMTQANESLGLTASQHIEKIMQHAGGVKVPIFDYALINTGDISAARLEQYAREGQQPIVADLERVRALGVEPVMGNFVHEGDVLRHDYDLLAERLLELGMERPVAVSGVG